MKDSEIDKSKRIFFRREVDLPKHVPFTNEGQNLGKMGMPMIAFVV